MEEAETIGKQPGEHLEERRIGGVAGGVGRGFGGGAGRGAGGRVRESHEPEPKARRQPRLAERVSGSLCVRL